MNKQSYRLLTTILGVFVLLACTIMLIISSIVLIDIVQSPPNFPTKQPPEVVAGNHISPFTLSDKSIIFGAGYCLYTLNIQSQSLKPVKCTKNWTFQQPVTDRNRIYAHILASPETNQSFVAIDTEDGSIIWDYDKLTGPYFQGLKNSTKLVDGRIYITRKEGIDALYAESGQRIWHTGHNWMNGPTPFIIYDNLLWYPVASDSVFSKDGTLVGVSLIDGEVEQRINLLPDFGFDQIVYIDDHVIVGIDFRANGFDQIFAVDRTASDKLIWSSALGPSSRFPVSQVLQRNDLIVFERNGTVYAINMDTGQEIWSFDPEIGDEEKFTSSERKNILVFQLYKGMGETSKIAIYALSASSGNMIWQYELQSHRSISLPLIVEDTVYVGNKDTIDAVGLTTGELLWQRAVDSKYEYYQEGD